MISSSSVGQRRLVQRFWLQKTSSFPGGAPQREEYLSDHSFHLACLLYESEWRAAYICGEKDCRNRDCPQHYPSLEGALKTVKHEHTD